MKQKHWQVSVFDKTSEIIRDDTFYTTDTEVHLIFELIDKDFTPDTATVTVYNVNGKATINVNVDVSGGIVRYEIPEEAIGHGGVWRTQVIFTKDDEDYTTGIINFDVSGHLLDNTKQKLVAITNWNRFIKHAEELIDDWEQLEEIRQANERQRELAEKKRHNEFKKNETSRQENEQGRESAEYVRVANEEERISKDSERDSKIETLEEQFQNVIDETTDKDVISAPELIAARNGEANLKTRLDKEKLEVTAQLQQNVRQITDLEGYVGYTESDILGIEADFENKTFTRIAGAVGLTPGTSFDAFNPFGGRKRCIITDTGVRLAYFGDVGYTETGKLTTELIVGGVTYPVGTIVQVMVEQPKFYYKVVPLKLDKVQDGKGFHLRKARYYVSAKHKAGFKIHPAFVRNGKEKNFVYLSAYEGAIYDESAGAYILDDAQVADFATDKLSSISGTKPASGMTQNLTRANTRKLAQNRGLGWEQAYGATVAATQLLFAIEYASFNTQSAIGMGVTKTDDATTNMAEPTGATTLLGNASGKVDNGSITYRGEENFWMNIWKWVDGLNIEAKGLHNLFVADNAFADDLGTTPYQDAGITLAKTSGYISAFAYNEKFDWLFFPSETSGNSSVPVGDYLYQNNTSNSWFTAHLGGAWSSGAAGGGFCWYVSNAAYTRTRTVGGRLVYVPGVVA